MLHVRTAGAQSSSTGLPLSQPACRHDSTAELSRQKSLCVSARCRRGVSASLLACRQGLDLHPMAAVHALWDRWEWQSEARQQGSRE